jgi:hypothetical protein
MPSPMLAARKYPIFVPAKSRVRVSLDIRASYPVTEKSYPSEEEQKQYTTEVAKYVTYFAGLP